MPKDLSHIPAPAQTPLIGNTLDLIRDAYGLHMGCIDAYGEIYRISMFGRWRVCLASAAGTEYILTDPDRIFSGAGGWDTVADLFPGGLFLRDFDDHRTHRRIMTAAFRKPALDSYLAITAPAMAAQVARWPLDRPLRLYPALKDLTLRLGAHVFMGLPVDSPEAPKLNRALSDEIAAGLTVIRKPLPFTRYRRGVTARARLTARFREMIDDRRAGDGADFFSRMCRARDEDGRGWSDDEIVDHFNFLMMAAHDTTASALSALTWYLALHPDWQEALAREVRATGNGPLTPDMLGAMPLTERVFNETMRLMAPVPFIPRLALRGFDWQGTWIPAGTHVTAMPGTVMLDPAHFPDPLRFDPNRFAPDRAEHLSHRFAYAPFGGGAHKCLGLHFSVMQVKSYVRALLSRHRVRLATKRPVQWQRLPIPKPRGGLPIRLHRRD
ncbi:cytochrome P450 [Pseudoponticoccus marisrubri]|uniref:Cytochrome P450 n=1 Tax=Pseudoponticoccus marisrubri TaxID=1685382 RepID=A0A0W7WFM3_9RHOB|nr:cytochrome P450 [Pseudoponticoccus marisrubri]KUF09420.1 cytochrome P450 [Pseudoponticoccus marisrubri]